MASCPRLHSTTALQAGRSSLPQRWLESDTGRCCRHGRSSRNHSHCRIDCCRRNNSSLRQRKFESDAERCCGVVRRHSGGFLLRIMPPSWHPVPACTPRLRCRRAILRCGNDGAAGGTTLLCGKENWNRTPHRSGNGRCRRAILLAGTMVLQ